MEINNKIIVVFIFALAFAMSGCQDMLDTNSDRIAFEDDNSLNSSSDSLYSVIGLLAQMQKIGDRCVVLGELRGDLMTVGNDASTDLKDINDFNASSDNTYGDKYNFYNIINNCNYAIAKMDTSITVLQDKVMLPEFAQIKAIRAWTYLQMAQIFGSVIYYTSPVLDLESSQASSPKIGMDELVALLIKDLLPYVDVRRLDYGTIDGHNSTELFVPIRMLLGDMYLYQNNYTAAAEMYYNLIKKYNYTISSNYGNYWSSDARTDVSNGHVKSFSNEVIFKIAYNSDLKKMHSKMMSLTYDAKPSLLPVTSFITSMKQATYFYSPEKGSAITKYFVGDLRGYASSSNIKLQTDAFGLVTPDDATIARNLITKFRNNISGSEGDELYLRPLTSLAFYRQPTLYLRYAEAINRAGKPSLAFAVLKYGLNRTTLSDTLRVDKGELISGDDFIQFSASQFDNNVGTAERGCGRGIVYDAIQYKIPDYTVYVNGKISTDAVDLSKARNDSIEYVENAILDEMTAETAFEGNRFFDLLCISRHRDNHPEFMATRVSAKFQNPSEMKSKLMTLSNWFLK